jgi:hypothetical protein
VVATRTREAWRAWTDLAGSGSAHQPIASAQDTFSALAAAVGELQEQAAAVVKERSQAWQPVAAALAGWLEVARTSESAAADLADVRSAYDWLRKGRPGDPRRADGPADRDVRADLGHAAAGTRSAATTMTHAPSRARPSYPYPYFCRVWQRIDAQRALLSVARKLARRCYHTLRDLGEQALERAA